MKVQKVMAENDPRQIRIRLARCRAFTETPATDEEHCRSDVFR